MKRWAQVVLLPLIIMMAVISLNWWLFRYTGTNYFIWYLKNGALIGLAVSFIALIWEELETREGLLSAHPLEYLVACFALMAIFFKSVEIHLSNPLNGSRTRDFGAGSVVVMLWDGWISLFALLIMMTFALAWLIVVAPLNFFVTLFSGALARQGLRGISLRPIIIRKEKEMILTSRPAKDDLSVDAIDVSLTRKPFALTQALTSLFLWIASSVFDSIA
jgi:hypothetical protein